jgi:CRP-like cAMP-binding protein
LRIFVDRLLIRSILTKDEQLALLGLRTREAIIPAGRDLRRYGEQSDYAAVISAGVVGRYHQAKDGRRNFVAVHLPGDMADLCTTVLKDVSFGLEALTDVTVELVSKADLLVLAYQYRGIFEAFWRDCVSDTLLIAQHVVRVAGLSARQKIAHLLCEMAYRLGVSSRQPCLQFNLGLTQSQLADFLGLTAVHVNRMLREIRDLGLAVVDRKSVSINDWSGLKQHSEFNPEYLSIPEPSER